MVRLHQFLDLAQALLGLPQPVDSVQQLGRRDRCQVERGVAVRPQESLEVEVASLRRDENARYYY